ETLDRADRGLADIIGRASAAASLPRDADGYADDMMTAIDAARRAARGVVVVLSPAETPQQTATRRALDMGLASGVRADWLRLVDLGAEPRLVTDPAMRIDGWNYSSSGIALAAGRIAEALVNLVSRS